MQLFPLLLLSFFLLITINCQNVNENTTATHYLPPQKQVGADYEHEHEHGSHEEVESPILGSGSGSGGPDLDIDTKGGTSGSTFPGIASTSRSRVVETKYGKVQGLSITLAHGRDNPLKNKIVEVYVGIPYASPPIKSHRFGPTQSAMPWEGVRDAVKPGFVCPQMMPDIRNETAALREMPRGYLEYLKKVEPYLRNQSEDCLYLNIYSPIGPEPKVRPVIVFIHGGKFMFGSGNLSDGTVMAAYGDVVFVSLNYRLNVLGFLNVHSLPNSKPRVANYGLMDQIAALHWIKENILKFGGDPENITLMGYEAGAACIHYLMASPAVTPGLFHRSILIAGSAQAPWALVSDPASAANALAQSLNCSLPTVNATQAVTPPTAQAYTGGQRGQTEKGKEDPVFECLKNKHFSEFSNFSPPKFAVDFGPSIDGVVIKPNFRVFSESQMGKRDVAKKYDLLFGLSSLEKMVAFSENDLLTGFEGQRRDAILRTLIRNSYRFHLNEILATISNEYTDWEKSSQHPIPTRDLTINAVTDCLALAPVIAASESRQINRGFFYVFEHATKDGLYNYVGAQGQRTGGVGGEELSYMFGTPLVEPLTGHVLPFIPPPVPSNFTKAEMALSEQIITFLSNFAHTGDPNEPQKGDLIWPVSKEKNRYRNTPWEAHDKLHQKYLEISANKIRPRSHYRAHQMAIWLRLVPELQRSGAHFASGLHNRMKGGNDPALYVGKLRHPLEGDDPLLHAPSILDIMGYSRGEEMLESVQEGASSLNLSGQPHPPAPPTTCFSPLASSSSPSVGAVELNKGGRERGRNESRPEQPTFSSPYSTALSVTIAVGCSLLILNVFIFALVYYQRDKKRGDERGKGQGQSRSNPNGPGNGNGNPSSSGKYAEPPELLKSNSTTCTNLAHHAGSPCGTPQEEFVQIQGQGQGQNQGQTGQGHPQSQSQMAQQQTLAQQALAQRGILLSPSAHFHHQHQHHPGIVHHYGGYPCPGGGIATLPRGTASSNNGGIGGQLPKPPPPPRSFPQNFGTLPHPTTTSRGSQQNLTYTNFDELKV